jgi:hypothetical protein
MNLYRIPFPVKIRFAARKGMSIEEKKTEIWPVYTWVIERLRRTNVQLKHITIYRPVDNELRCLMARSASYLF